MLGWVWDFLIYSIPWWVWVWVVAPILIFAAIYVSRVIGWRNAIPVIGGAIVAFAAAFIGLKGRQQGARDQQQKEQRNADKTLDRAHDARRDARNADPSRLRDDDGFRRDD